MERRHRDDIVLVPAVADRYDNGAPLWGKVSKIVYPNDSWEEFTYQTDTGWLYQDITPYESGIPDAAGQNVVQYAYEQNLSGSGAVADPNALSAQPTEVAHYIAGVMVGEEFDQWTIGPLGVQSPIDG